MQWVIRLAIVGVCVYVLICFLYYKYQEKIIFYPQKVALDYRYSYPLAHTEFNVTTPDGNRLNGAICQHDSTRKGVVLYFHGNASHVYELGWMAKMVYDFGYDFMVYDYRGFGKSTGIIKEANLFSDARLMYDYLLSEYGYAKEEVVIYGRSIGSGVAVKLASEVETAKMLVLETPYASLLDLGKYYTPYLPYPWLMRFRLESDRYIQSAEMPTYIFHGTADKIVPYDSGKKLSEAAPNLQELITIEGAGHDDFYEYSRYEEKITEIFGGN